MKKPNANESLAVASSAVYAWVDFEQVARCDAQAARRLETKRAAHHRRKQQRTAARAYITGMNSRDPCSDGEQ